MATFVLNKILILNFDKLNNFFFEKKMNNLFLLIKLFIK